MSEREMLKMVEPNKAIVRERATALARCTFPCGSWDKRFSRSVSAIVEAGCDLTERQAENVDRLAHEYRRQMPSRLVPPLSPVSGPEGEG